MLSRQRGKFQLFIFDNFSGFFLYIFYEYFYGHVQSSIHRISRMDGAPKMALLPIFVNIVDIGKFSSPIPIFNNILFTVCLTLKCVIVLGHAA